MGDLTASLTIAVTFNDTMMDHLSESVLRFALNDRAGVASGTGGRPGTGGDSDRFSG
jgi:hypothetical protein